MRKFIILFSLLNFCVGNRLFAQSATDSVKVTIQQLFKGMKNADGEMVKNCFADSAIMQTITKNKSGNDYVKTDLAANFVSQIKTLEKDAADERITIEAIHVNGPLAVVWTPYQFFWKGKFSHCGVNSFQLVRIDQQWKIQYIIDTRQKVNCQQ